MTEKGNTAPDSSSIGKVRTMKNTRLLGAALVLASLLATCCISPVRGAHPPAGFSLQELRDAGPFLRVVVWAPRPGSKGNYDTILFLHGNQPPTIPDPNWFAEIRHYPPFDQKILIVPALAHAEEWSQPATIQALDRLLNRIVDDYPTNRKRIFLAGFSSGGFQGFLVASLMQDRFAGFASLAANVPRATTATQLSRLRGLPILLVCMELDTAVVCARQSDNVKRLHDAGVLKVDAEQIAGIGHECHFNRVAPVLARWMESMK